MVLNLIKNLILITALVMIAAEVGKTEEQCPSQKHAVYCQILRNKPRIDRKFAMALSNQIARATSKHRVPANVYTAILMQESTYKVEALGCHKGYAITMKFNLSSPDCKREHWVKLEECKELPCSREILAETRACVVEVRSEEETLVCSDYGIGQIHYKTVERFGFDVDKLTSDLSYSVEAGAIVLAGFRRMYAHKEVDWWTRYNASTPSKRSIYKTLVQNYL